MKVEWTVKNNGLHSNVVCKDYQRIDIVIFVYLRVCEQRCKMYRKWELKKLSTWYTDLEIKLYGGHQNGVGVLLNA